MMIRKLSNVLLVGACALAFSAPALASSFTVLHTFKGGRHDGSGPNGLTPDGQGGFYGTTFNGGDQACNQGCGTVFHIAADGTWRILHIFGKGDDGVEPAGNVVVGADGSLYGTTTGQGHGYAGVVYRITPDGQESILYGFKGGEDGYEPVDITLDKKGNIYGVTIGGGQYGLGTLFKVTPAGKETQLHAFAEGETDGGEPDHGVVFDKAGNLYGSTPWGGSAGGGTVFKVTPQGDYSVFYNFPGDAGGAQPRTDLIMDQSGNFYGTTSGGGDYGYGTVFQLTSAGVETVLHSFSGGAGDGGYPQAGVIFGRKGKLYGTTSGQGTGTAGTIFKLAADGTETVLHALSGKKDGEYPTGTLLADGLGNLYGVAEAGGSTNGACNPYGCGTVFRLPER